MNHIESNSIQFYLAPMESVTGYVYRTVYQAMFGDMDKYVTPFIAPSKKKILKTRERKDVTGRPYYAWKRSYRESGTGTGDTDRAAGNNGRVKGIS